MEEEYAMQESWHKDADKCTFILLSKSLPVHHDKGVSPSQSHAQESQDSQPLLPRSEQDSMIGDVNLFFNLFDEPHTAEIEIMIADPAYRRLGCGWC